MYINYFLDKYVYIYIYIYIYKNAINVHVHQCGSPILWKETQIIYRQNNFHLRNVLETACINYSKQSNFNTSQGLFKLDPIVSHIISQQYKMKLKF